LGVGDWNAEVQLAIISVGLLVQCEAMRHDDGVQFFKTMYSINNSGPIRPILAVRAITNLPSS